MKKLLGKCAKITVLMCILTSVYNTTYKKLRHFAQHLGLRALALHKMLSFCVNRQENMLLCKARHDLLLPKFVIIYKGVPLLQKKRLPAGISDRRSQKSAFPLKTVIRKLRI